ncbi:MAG TPA: hypothetical protein VFZ18_00165 [Longimicrobiaceae bacterium]
MPTPSAAIAPLGVFSLLLAAGLSPPAAAQTLTRDNYYESLPSPPSIVAQTEATQRFQLFGDSLDPAYEDRAPRDGVDDRRADRLLDLSEHFSPILRRNTYLVPLEFEDALHESVSIQIDAWRDHLRVDSGVVELGPRLTGDGYMTGAPRVAPDDSLLLHLLKTRGPRRVRSPIAPPAPSPDTILYIDVPGHDEFSWRPHHRARLPARSRIYAHPFIHEVEGTAGDPLYELIIQYWFYYPFNDGGNNHEGDWEHISVSITSHARQDPGTSQRGLLTAEEVRALLDPVAPTPLDSLRLRNVAYYFHNNVMEIPYLDLAAGGSLTRRSEKKDGAVHVWEDMRYMDEGVRLRMTVAGGRFATHPFGYIGGNNKGMDELLQVWPRFQRSYNRDSHGTYPFPGIWRKVGPVEATEKIFGEIVPRLHRDDAGNPDPDLPWYELIDNDRYLVYRRDAIILMPDWERLEPLVLAPEEAEVRRRWAWMILPVHMGFPATRSPGAGTLKRVDLGNVAPMSPAHNSAWNRPGVTAVYPPYEPTVLRVALAPGTPVTSLQSGWGLFNIPLVLFGMLPGGSVAITQLLPWATGAMNIVGSPPAKTFQLGALPERFTSVSGGSYRQFGGNDFARLLPDPDHPAVQAQLGEAGDGELRMEGVRRVPNWGSRAWFNVYFGNRLSIENTLDYGAADVSYSVRGAEGQSLAFVSGRLHTREVTGGLNYRLTPVEQEWARIYGRAGYGWTDYTVSGVRVNGAPTEGTRVEGGHLPKIYPSLSWWPNTTYVGLGLEVFAPPRYWLLNRLGAGARIEVGGPFHRMAIAGDCHYRVTTERGDVAMMLLFGW